LALLALVHAFQFPDIGFLPPVPIPVNISMDPIIGGSVDVPLAVKQWADSKCGSNNLKSYGTGPFCYACSDEFGICKKVGDTAYNWFCSGRNYPYDCMGYYFSLRNLQYGTPQSAPNPSFVWVQYFDNRLNVAQMTKFTRSEQGSNTYQWAQTNTISNTLSMEVEVSVPEIVKVKDSFSTTITMSTTNTQTKQSTKTWSVEQDITIPAMTTVKASMVVERVKYNVPYTAQIRFTGYGMAWCNEKRDDHYCWFPNAANILPPFGCSTTDGNDAVCNLSGMFVGVTGVRSVVQVQQCALGVHC
jgi:hypothetical protein